MGVSVAMIHEDIKTQNWQRTKPQPASTLHRHARFCKGQRFYPGPETEHGRLMQVEMVNQRLTEFDTNPSNALLDY